MFKRVLYFVLILTMLLGAVGCTDQQRANAQTWKTLFFGSKIEVQNLPKEYTESGLDAINRFLGENCPLKKDLEVDGNGQIYTICRDTEGEVIEVKTADMLTLGVTAVTIASPIVGDEIVAIKWAWNGDKTVKVIIAIVFAAEASQTIGNIAYTRRHSNPAHDPRTSEVARQKITEVSDKVTRWFNDPKKVPYLYCAVAVYENGSTYVRVLSSVDGTTGTMGWFGPEGWVGAFSGKDVYGFLNGKPRGAISYDVSRPLKDCLNALGKVPSASTYAP